MTAQGKGYLRYGLFPALLVAFTLLGRAQDMDLPSWDDDDNLDLIDAFEEELAAESQDFDLLRLSHVSEVYLWEGVRPAKGADDDKTYAWAVTRSEPFPPRRLVSPPSAPMPLPRTESWLTTPSTAA